ncbi:O-antigen ligase family protein [Marinobacter maritimus]|uniref:O-antigen ligase family protein n=1 Tax=Marinobacter maritimus TaxID=277961 RepID=UPI0011A4404E|nr:O-antigen ligase family protein [Marinobacter maritimus]
MQKAWNAALWLFVAVVFASVLFADFLLLPFGGYASQRFILACLLALVVSFSVVGLIYQHGWALLGRVWSVVVVAGGFLLLALPFGEAPHNWAEPGLYAAFFLGFVLAGSLPGSDKHRQYFVVVLVSVAAASTSAYGGATITVYLFALSDQVANLSNFIPWGFVSIRYWSHIATWLIPLLPLAVLIGPLQNQRLWRFFIALGAALWWWVVFLSSSRGTMLGLAFGVLVAIVLIGRPALPWLKMFLRYLTYGVIAWLFLSVLVPSLLLNEVSMRALKADTSGRVPLFIEAWRMSLENFPLGMGPQSWLTHEVLTEGYLQSPKFGHPHNMYLMWAAEYGWLLIGALLILMSQAVRRFWKLRDEVRVGERTDLVLPIAAFTASVSAALLHAGVSAVFIAPGSMLIGFLVLCVFWALISPESRPVTPKLPKVRALAAVFVGLLMSVLCLYWLSEVTEYYKAMEGDREFYYENVPAGTLPRFWFHGNFPRHPNQMP